MFRELLISIVIAVAAYLFVACTAVEQIEEGSLASINQNVNVAELAASPTPTRSFSWNKPDILGLKLGESKESDVRRLFGEPVWEGAPEEKIFNKEEGEIEIEYHNVAAVSGNVAITIGSESRLVKAFAVYPSYSLDAADVIFENGPNFVVVAPGKSICRSIEHSPVTNNRSLTYPNHFVYPEKGVSFVSSRDGKIVNYTYLVHCIE
jgi:S1-C subfamily serine protease